MSLKSQLHSSCVKTLDQKINALQEEIKVTQNDAQEETKSSAGDKYETGRAMMHLEMEKLSSQLNEFLNARQILNQIDPTKNYPVIQLGSVVLTSAHNYFLSISAGTVEVDQKQFFCISPASPIGALLVGKKKGDQFSFRNQQINILEIF
jgi:transcription elongation GreA/GreB family factor